MSTVIIVLAGLARAFLQYRFTYRNDVIRIIGAGYWRKGKAIYERENKIHDERLGEPG